MKVEKTVDLDFVVKMNYVLRVKKHQYMVTLRNFYWYLVILSAILAT